MKMKKIQKQKNKTNSNSNKNPHQMHQQHLNKLQITSKNKQWK